MPAATTHAEFAKSVYEAMPEEKKQKITSLPMYYLGSQGPDLFFFHRYMFLPNSLHQYGNLIHSQKVKETIAYMKAHTPTPALHSYYCGFLTHYSLDAFCHPIINAFAKMEQDLHGTHVSEAHFRLEGEIDGWLLNKLGRSVKDYNVYNMLKISDQEVKELARMYHGLFQIVYALNIPEKTIENACRDCMRITRQLRPQLIQLLLLQVDASPQHQCLQCHLISSCLLCVRPDQIHGGPVRLLTHTQPSGSARP